MLENIVVGVLLVGFVVFCLWALAVHSRYIRSEDLERLEAAKKGRNPKQAR